MNPEVICVVFGSALFGGHEMMAARMVHALPEGVRVRVIARPEHHDQIRAFGTHHVDYVTLDHRERRFESLLGWLNPRVYRACGELRRATAGCRTIVVVNGGLTANHALTLAVARLDRVEGRQVLIYYPMVHTPEEIGLSPARGRSNLRALHRVTSAVSDYITIDEIWKQRLLEISRKPLHVSVVHNLVDVSGIQRSVRPTARADAQVYRLCFAGRLDRRQKGLDLLAEVMECLAQRSAGPVIELSIIGDGPDRADFQSRCEALASERLRFRFLGWQSSAVPMMASQDALVLSSRVEGVPTVVVEALLLGIRVVAFDIPGLDRLLPPHALVTAFDTAAMAAWIDAASRERQPEAVAVAPYVRMLTDKARYSQEVRQAVRLEADFRDAASGPS